MNEELLNRNKKVVVRKSLVANSQIKKGEIFTEKNVGIKRPGNGISPMHWDEVIGKTAKKGFTEDEILENIKGDSLCKVYKKTDWKVL